ncbi:MAG: selenide, water dikinase SelD [Bacteroidetes bacterium]|nr:selenide, water dikinase SelD [Bacteroidota bacterium]
MTTPSPIRLTQFSHGAGCGCKIAPSVLDQILKTNTVFPDQASLLVGNHSRDDAAVLDLGNGMALISTTDFFMPIVDDPIEFGRIAATNAISDVYAMGGMPTLAIAILGWPVDKLPPEIAGQVVEGGRLACLDAGIPLAGGHSIDSPEPIFGLAVNGLVPVGNLKRNNTAQAGDLLFLTKGLGVGILTTAEKRQILLESDKRVAAESMMKLNRIGADLGKLEAVHALTDVTGFGLLGHLAEMAGGSGVHATLYPDRIPRLTDLTPYLEQKSVPGGTNRNFNSYGHQVSSLTPDQKALLCDPQTSGGLLIALSPDGTDQLRRLFNDHGIGVPADPIGELIPAITNQPMIQIRS